MSDPYQTSIRNFGPSTPPARMKTPIRPGCRLRLHINQGWRDATVLAVRRELGLVEYEMPAGTTALLVVTFDEDGEPLSQKSVTYRRLSKAWLQAIVYDGREWIGRPQQAGRKSAPSAEALLQERSK